MGECGLYLGRREVGRLRWERFGGKQRFSAACPAEAGKIYRVVLCTDSGEYRLGVMLPEDGVFHLQRELSTDILPHRAFVDRTLPGEHHLPNLPLAVSAFSAEDLPEDLPRAESLLAAWWDGTCYLLYPFPPGRGCGTAMFFSITTVIESADRSWGVFCFREGQYIPLTDRLRGRNMIE